MKKSTIIMMVSIVLAIALGVGGTLAYLTSTDEDVNVMTLGNVSIAQLEYERVTDEDGNWVSTGETDKYGYTPDEIKDFTQAKPLYPAYFADGKIKWDDRNGSEAASGEGSHQQSWGQVKGEKATGAPGSNQLFDDSVYGAQDKFVFVENTGTSDAYVRTWFAFELGSVEADKFFDIVELNNNDANGEAGAGHWAWEWQEGAVEIDGNNYRVACATYLGPKSNPTGILAPGTISYPSLLQVYMKPTATNEDVAAIDGNGNGMYDILVKTQATQTVNFDNAQQALEASFGDELPWEEVVIPDMIYNYEQLKAAFAKGGDYIIGADFDMSGAAVVNDGLVVNLNMNGHTLNCMSSNGYSLVAQRGGLLTIFGEGGINGNGGFATNRGSAVLTINGGTYNMTATQTLNGQDCHSVSQNVSTLVINDGTFISNAVGASLFKATSNATLEINGGFFYSAVEKNPDLLDYGMNQDSTNRIVLKGGTFVNYDPKNDADSLCHEMEGNEVVKGPYMVIAKGYTVVSETQANGDVWYTVVPE